MTTINVELYNGDEKVVHRQTIELLDGALPPEIITHNNAAYARWEGIGETECYMEQTWRAL